MSLLVAAGRRPEDVRRSLMTSCYFAADAQGLDRKLAASGRSRQQLLDRGMIVGVGSEVIEQLQQRSDAGVQRIMLQWLDLDDLDGLREFAKVVL